MKRVVWLTDIHLNFLMAQQVSDFLALVVQERPDAVLIGGDIAESQNVCHYLERLHEAIDAPIYFVLGNHDYYHGSIAHVRERVDELCRQLPRLHFLSRSEVAELTPHVGLVGHDGCADGRLGDYPRSLVMMHDYKLIAELAGRDKRDRWEVLKSLADEAATHIRRVLPLALARYREAMLLTHVPPWREACWHEGRISDDQWTPHFTCQAMGQAILDVMAAHADSRLTVLCGHTHGLGENQAASNAQVFTGGAEYGHPTIQRVFELD